MWHKINSADQAIDELGGTLMVATLFGVDERVVSNWRKRGLPPDTYAGLAPMLAQRGVTFSGALFGQRALVNRRPPKRLRKRNGAR
jgi:hypothetical protein